MNINPSAQNKQKTKNTYGKYCLKSTCNQQTTSKAVQNCEDKIS